MTGYRTLPTSDPEEQRLRTEWHKAKQAKEEGEVGSELTFGRVDALLCAYLWRRCSNEIEEDRRKHPKAKRNQPVPKGEVGEGRVLP